MPKALKTCPKSNKLPNLVTLNEVMSSKKIKLLRVLPLWHWTTPFNCRVTVPFIRVVALVLWLWVTTDVWKIVGSNPGAVYWLDIFSHWFVVNIVCLKIPKINVKRPGLAHLFKKTVPYLFSHKMNNIPVGNSCEN